MQKIELNKVFIELLTPQLILISTKDNSVLEIEDLEEMKKTNLELTKGAKYGVISETGNYTSVSSEGRKHMTTKGIEKNKIAAAFIINSLSQRLLFNFFIRFNKPSVHTKSFSNMKHAREWIDFQLNLL